MPDNLNRRGPEDPHTINIHQPWELAGWAMRLGVTTARLISAVNTVGSSVSKVKKYLKV